MKSLLIATRLILGIVFLVAGLTKLLDIKGSRKAITEFGLPAWSADSLGVGLPLAELMVAAFLLYAESASVGSTGALSLSLLFTGAIALNMALGRRPECHCFGQVHSKPIGWGTLARSAMLAGVAGWLLWQSRAGQDYSPRLMVNDLNGAQIASALFGLLVMLLFCALFWLVLHLFRQNGRLLLRIEALEANQHNAKDQAPPRSPLHGLPIGSPAVHFDLPLVSGGELTLANLLANNKPVLLISTNPNCGPCNALMPEIAIWQKTLADVLSIVLISHGSADGSRAKANEYGLKNVLLAPDYKVAERYQAAGTPTGVVIRSTGTIGSPAVGGPEAIRQLVAHQAWTESGLESLMKVLGHPYSKQAPSLALPLGSKAPTFTLPDLDGTPVTMPGTQGGDAVLLFWNTSCGFCQKMLPQLKLWELRKPLLAPRLVVITAGSQESIRAMDLKASVLLDDKFAVGMMYGSRGTPSGVLIDSGGNVASGVAVGESETLNLLLHGGAKKSTFAHAPAAQVG